MTSAIQQSDPPVSHAVRLRRYLELIRFSHTIFALPFAAVSLVLVLHVSAVDWGGKVGYRHVFALLLCMVFARSAAMAFNRLVDHRIDAANARTAARHLPAGLLSRGEVGFFTIGCALGFIASCGLFWPNWLPLAAAVPVLLFLCGYSLAKRFTAGAHLWLGVALALAPICVWIAIGGQSILDRPIDLLPAVVLATAVAFWVTGFDIIYACQDEHFDRQSGLFSIPVRLGTRNALRLSAGLHALMVACLLLLPYSADGLSLGWVYIFSVVVIAGLLAYEHAIVRPDDLQRVNVAFFNVNALISIILLVAVVIDVWLLT